MTTGQGGALITDNEELYEKIIKIRDFGRSSGGNDNYLIKGWNMKFTDIQAVIGICQMKKLPDRVIRKKNMVDLYYKLLRNIDGVSLISTDFDNTTLWFMDILCEYREELIIYLKSKGIGTRKVYPALHSEPAYGYAQDFPNAEMVARKGLWLPSYVELRDEEIEFVCSNIRKFYENKLWETV